MSRAAATTVREAGGGPGPGAGQLVMYFAGASLLAILGDVALTHGKGVASVASGAASFVRRLVDPTDPILAAPK